MALRSMLDALGMIPSEEHDADTESTTDTGTSDEFVDSFEQQDATMTKREIESQAPAGLAKDDEEGVAVATPDSSSKLSYEVLTPAGPVVNDEIGREMTKPNIESGTAPEASKDSGKAVAIFTEANAEPRDVEDDLAKGDKKTKTISDNFTSTPQPSKVVITSNATGTVAGAAQLGKMKGSKLGGEGMTQGILLDEPDEDRIEPAKKNKPKPSSKRKKKTAAKDMTSSSSDSTVKASTDRSAAATTTNDSILAFANLTVSNPTNTSISSPAPTRFTTPAPANVVAPASTPRKVQLVLKHPFGFDEHREEIKCRKSECGKLTNCYDGSTVICPRCGVTSYFRYCSLEHLLDKDMMFHWATECGTCSIPPESLPLVDKSTLIVRPAGMRPYISCSLRDNPARHRQAVYHSSNGPAGDYFVFNDASLRPAGPLSIGAGDIIAVVSITPDAGVYQGQSIFHEILEDCLRRGFTRPDKCLALADVVTKELVKSGQWGQEVVDCLVFQMVNEFAYQIPQEILYRFQPVV